MKKFLKKIIKVIKRSEFLRKTYAYLACLRYGFPSNKLIVFGITGTNGKTTTSYFLKSVLECAGFKTGLIGTSGYWLDEKIKLDPPAVSSKPVTTPDPFYLQYLFSQMLKRNTKYVVLEVSSFGLRDFRVYKTNFKGAILTNISDCHHSLEHGGFNNYVDAKKRLFLMLNKNSIAVLPKESEFFEEFKKASKAKVVSYGLDSFSDVKGEIIKDSIEQTIFKVIKGDLSFSITLSKNTGYYNVLNALAVVALALELNIDPEKIKQGIENCPAIEGRFEFFENKGVRIIVDKANTPNAFLEVIKKVKKLNPRRIIGVYGNFFEFPLNIRFKLAEIATSHFDLTIITADDSKNKPVEEGINDFLNFVVDKVPSEKYLAIKDRKEAIKEAIKRADKGDIVLVLGRGDEKLMTLNGKVIEFDDRKVVKELINELK